MKAAWTRAMVLLAISFLAVIGGAWMTWTARSLARFPQEVHAARESLGAAGGEHDLVTRLEDLAKLRRVLGLERAARASNAAVFSQRVEAVFAELGLLITASSEWQAVPDLTSEEMVTFERTFEGSGAFDALLDAIHTIEQWPDRAGLRALTVNPEAEGLVAFTLKVVTIRRARSDEQMEIETQAES